MRHGCPQEGSPVKGDKANPGRQGKGGGTPVTLRADPRPGDPIP